MTNTHTGTVLAECVACSELKYQSSSHFGGAHVPNDTARAGGKDKETLSANHLIDCVFAQQACARTVPTYDLK